MRTLKLLLLLIPLASCAGTGPAVDCQAWRPILTSGPETAERVRAQLRDLGIATPDAVHDAIKDRDVLTAETARSILAHNLTGRRLCGW